MWATAPLLTFGFGTWAVFLFAAIKRRSLSLAGATALYAVLLTVSGIADSPAHPGPLAKSIGALGLMACMLGGGAHALAIRRRVFNPVADRSEEALRQAEAAALERRKLRQHARELAARDPGLACELRIGRPALRRDFDDGGLVDVNHATAPELAGLPGMTPELAAKAVGLRQERGPFVSADEVSDALGLPPYGVADLADRTIYLP